MRLSAYSKVSVAAGVILAVFLIALPDAQANNIASAEYVDNDRDGTVERIKITLSHPVVSCAFEKVDWTFPVNGSMDFNEPSLIEGACNGSNNHFFLFFNNTIKGVTGSGQIPKIGYTDSGSSDSIITDEGPLTTFSSFPITDKAPPALYDPKYIDQDGDGEIDRIQLSVSSEPTLNYTFNSVDWVVTDNGLAQMRGPVQSGTLSGDDLYLELNSAREETTKTTGNPTLTYTNNGRISDGAGNQLGNQTFILKDGAAPVPIDVEYVSDAAGKIDKIQLVMSEDGMTCAFDKPDWSVVTGGSIGLKSIDSCSATGSTVTLNVTSTTTATGGLTDPVIRYSGDGLRDSSNNEASFTDQTVIDATSPKIATITPAFGSTGVSATKQIVIQFTEPMLTDSISLTSTPSKAYSYSWDANNRTVTISHDAWSAGQQINFTLSATAANGKNPQLAGTKTWTYTITGADDQGAGEADEGTPADTGDQNMVSDGGTSVSQVKSFNGGTYVEPTDRQVLLAYISQNNDPACESNYRPLVESDFNEFGVSFETTTISNALTFVCYGISFPTKGLGAGERRALLRDYLDTTQFSDIRWDDVARNAVGLKLIHRNMAREQQQLSQAIRFFEAIYGARPDFSDPEQDLAWNTLMYRIRFERDLSKEAPAIDEFERIFGFSPSTPFHWSAVRVLAYVK